jgi:Zn finger protein HypA/HybF involved in hydrogenase expression
MILYCRDCETRLEGGSDKYHLYCPKCESEVPCPVMAFIAEAARLIKEADPE